jgi:signal transduction histidine kinase/ligand-binding sensor domain-containing protein
MKHMRSGIMAGFVLFFLRSAPLPAQSLGFQHLTTDDGLSDNAITCVYEDRGGYIWIGTENGLDRYDGQRVDRIEGAGDHITAFLEDRQGARWATTKDHGLLRLDPAGGLKTFRHDAADGRSIASDQLTALYDLNDTTILIGSRQVSLIFCDKRTLAFTYWTDSLSLSPARASAHPSPYGGWCHAIVPLDERLLWIGFLNFHETLLADRGSGDVLHRLQVARTGSESQTTALLLGDTLYNGGWQSGVDVIPMADRPGGLRWVAAPRVIDLPDETLAMVPWHDGRIIAGTRAMGLFIIDPAEGRAERRMRSRYDPTSLLSDRIRCLFVDHTGTLWVGTADGLSRHVPAVWNATVRDLYPESDAAPPALFFHRVEPGANGDIRVYTSDGFFILDASLRSIHHEAVTHDGMPLQPTVMGFAHDGKRWLGTEYGIVGYDPMSGMDGRAFEPNDGQGHAYRPGNMFQVRGIWPDEVAGRAVMIIGTMGFGVNVMDARTGLTLGAAMPPAAASVNTRNLVNCVVRAPDGTYWAASADGVFHWRSDQPILAKVGLTSGAVNNDGIIAPGEDVRQLLLAGDTLWAVTHGGSLFAIVNGAGQLHVPPAHMHAAMHGLTMDHRGMLWITTDNGLLRFDPKDGSFLHVPINEGRAFRKLTRAITTLPDGRIAFCAENALIVLDPGVYDGLPAIAEPYMASATAAGSPLSVVDGHVDLSYRASSIDIGLSAMAHGYPQPLLFEYRLEGVEEEWRSTTAREAVRYASVPTGAHNLLVRVRDPFGRVGAAKALLTIDVAGPIWQQWWFYTLALLLISSGLYAFYSYRLGQAMKLQAVRNRIASDLHDEVGSSLSSITIGSQLAARLSPDASDQVKKLLARMGETSSESLRSISDIVWAIDPKNDEGEALVKRMRRIAQELLESKGVDVSFDVGTGVEELKLPMNARKEILLIYKEAMHNASKYSGASLVQVSLHRHNGNLAVSVKDDGRGFDVALHPDGHGLGSMKRRADALGAALTLNSTPGMGTLVGVVVDLTRIRD